MEETLPLISREEALQSSSSLNIHLAKRSLKKACQNPQWWCRRISFKLSIRTFLSHLRPSRIYTSLTETWRMTPRPATVMISSRVKIFSVGNSSLRHFLIPHATIDEHFLFLYPLWIRRKTIHHLSEWFTSCFELYFCHGKYSQMLSSFHRGMRITQNCSEMSVGWNLSLPKEVLKPHKWKHWSLFKSLKTACSWWIWSSCNQSHLPGN